MKTRDEQDFQDFQDFTGYEQDFQDFQDLPRLGFWCAGHHFGKPRGI